MSEQFNYLTIIRVVCVLRRHALAALLSASRVVADETLPTEPQSFVLRQVTTTAVPGVPVVVFAGYVNHSTRDFAMVSFGNRWWYGADWNWMGSTAPSEAVSDENIVYPAGEPHFATTNVPAHTQLLWRMTIMTPGEMEHNSRWTLVLRSNVYEKPKPLPSDTPREESASAEFRIWKDTADCVGDRLDSVVSQNALLGKLGTDEVFTIDLPNRQGVDVSRLSQTLADCARR